MPSVREALGEGGQRLRADKAGHLPVADGGILAHARLAQAGKAAGELSLRQRRADAPLDAVDVEQAELCQGIGPKIGMPGDGGKGVGALVAKGGGVRLGADAEAVQHDQKHAFCHGRYTPCL